MIEEDLCLKNIFLESIFWKLIERVF